MAENKKPIEMDVTVTYHIESIEALAKDIAGALLALVELKSDIERQVFVDRLFSGLYKKPSEEAPADETPADETDRAEEAKKIQ